MYPSVGAERRVWVGVLVRVRHTLAPLTPAEGAPILVGQLIELHCQPSNRASRRATSGGGLAGRITRSMGGARVLVWFGSLCCHLPALLLHKYISRFTPMQENSRILCTPPASLAGHGVGRSRDPECRFAYRRG